MGNAVAIKASAFSLISGALVSLYQDKTAKDEKQDGKRKRKTQNAFSSFLVIHIFSLR